MNHSLSDTNCVVSSADLDPSDGNTATVTSSESYVPITSDTHDQENNTIVASTTVLEDSTNSRPLIFATTSTVEKITAFQHCTCKEGRLTINLKYKMCCLGTRLYTLA